MSCRIRPDHIAVTRTASPRSFHCKRGSMIKQRAAWHPRPARRDPARASVETPLPHSAPRRADRPSRPGSALPALVAAPAGPSRGSRTQAGGRAECGGGGDERLEDAQHLLPQARQPRPALHRARQSFDRHVPAVDRTQQGAGHSDRRLSRARYGPESGR